MRSIGRAEHRRRARHNQHRDLLGRRSPRGARERRGHHDGQGYNPAKPSRLQGGRFSMKRKAYGRDAGLTLRMLFTSSLLGLLYVAFALVLFYVFNAGLVLMLVIVLDRPIFQYYTSHKLALAAERTHIAEHGGPVMTVASFFATLAPVGTRFVLYAGFFGGFGGNRDNNN